MANLDREALIQILTEPKNALVKQYQKMFELDGAELDFERSALEAIADKAIERGTGARGCGPSSRSPCSRSCSRSPSRGGDVAKVVITEGVVTEGRAPLMVTSKESEKDSDSSREDRTA